jgi:hypothetical protein
MRKRKTVNLMTLVGLTTLLLTVAWSVFAQDVWPPEPWADWSPAGSYTGTNNQGELLLVTVIPSSADSTRFSIVRDALNQNPGWEGRRVTRGEMVRIGPNQYAVTVTGLVHDENFKLEVRAVVSGTIEQTGPDTLETDLALAAYGPDADPFAEGAIPFMCFPGVKDSLGRVPIVAPCVPAPPPGG